MSNPDSPELNVDTLEAERSCKGQGKRGLVACEGGGRKRFSVEKDMGPSLRMAI